AANSLRSSADPSSVKACLFFSSQSGSDPSTQVYTASTGKLTSSMCDTANSGAVGTSVVSSLDISLVNADSLNFTVAAASWIVGVTRFLRGAMSSPSSAAEGLQNSISQENERPSTSQPRGSDTGRYSCRAAAPDNLRSRRRSFSGVGTAWVAASRTYAPS